MVRRGYRTSPTRLLYMPLLSSKAVSPTTGEEQSIRDSFNFPLEWFPLKTFAWTRIFDRLVPLLILRGIGPGRVAQDKVVTPATPEIFAPCVLYLG